MRDAAGVAILASLLTAALAAPVIDAPSARLFGMASAGHHHDPFTVMRQFEQSDLRGFLQPVTDVPGALLTRAAGPVRAYNAVVLVSFPLSAVAAFLLARYLGIGAAWAIFAALAFAFSPFHLAHAAYHPHVAQTQWLPLYLLALWRCLDRPGPGAIGALAGAALAVSLSNLYGGLIAASITLPAVAAHWYGTGRRSPRAWRRVALTLAVLAVVAGGVAIYALAAMPMASTSASRPDDLARYGARWWSYLIAPVAHPVAGTVIREFWQGASVDAGLIEQQVTIGAGVVLLAVVGIAAWLARGAPAMGHPAVPVALAVGASAFVLSLAPSPMAMLPASTLHEWLPMFRSFARFGVIVQLMAVVIASMGAQWLWQRGTRGPRVLCAALVMLAAAEYAVWPPAMSRAVFATEAHAWAAATPDVRVLDCAPAASDAGAVAWLTKARVSPYHQSLTDCDEPNFAEKLSAAGFTHLIERRDSGSGRWSAPRRGDGLQVAMVFEDSLLYAVAAPAPPVHTVEMRAFRPRERDSGTTWRWMEREASWWFANGTNAPIEASLDLVLSAFQQMRTLDVLLDGHLVQTVSVGTDARTYRLGPMSITPGGHTLSFHPSAGAESSGLTFRFESWRWLPHEAPR